MAIKNFEKLYQKLGQRVNYNKTEVLDLIDVDAFRKTVDTPGRLQKAWLEKTSIFENQYESPEQLLNYIWNTLNLSIRRTMSGDDVKEGSKYSIKVESNTDDIYMYYYEKQQPVPETDQEVVARVIEELNTMARAARTKHVSKTAELDRFKISLNSMNLTRDQKDSLIQQFIEDNGMNIGDRYVK